MKAKTNLAILGLLSVLTAVPAFAKENTERIFQRSDEDIAACRYSPVVLQSEYCSENFEEMFGIGETWTTNDTDFIEVTPLTGVERPSACVEVIRNLHASDIEQIVEVQHIWVSDENISETDPAVQSHDLENGQYSNMEVFEINLGNLNTSKIPGFFECRVCGAGKQMNSLVLGFGSVMLIAFVIWGILAFI